jgi:hypothetical protein
MPTAAFAAPETSIAGLCPTPKKGSAEGSRVGGPDLASEAVEEFQARAGHIGFSGSRYAQGKADGYLEAANWLEQRSNTSPRPAGSVAPTEEASPTVAGCGPNGHCPCYRDPAKGSCCICHLSPEPHPSTGEGS